MHSAFNCPRGTNEFAMYGPGGQYILLYMVRGDNLFCFTWSRGTT